jgi:hypothetical protein
MTLQPQEFFASQAIQVVCQPGGYNPISYALAPERLSDFAALKRQVVQAARKSDVVVVPNIKLPAAREQIASALDGNKSTVILSADDIVSHPEQYREIASIIDRKPNNRAGSVSLLFEESKTFSENYFSEPRRKEHWRLLLVKNELPRSTALTVQIMNLLDTHFEGVDAARRTEFLWQLERLVRRTPFAADQPPDFVIDPVSGLRFYPTPKEAVQWVDYAATLPRSSKYYSRDPGAFLFDQYGDYHRSGLLYTGHIRRADPKLYDSIRMFAQSSADYLNADDFFVRNGILTAADLANPSPEKSSRVKAVLDINVALAGRQAVLAQVSGYRLGQDRREVARNLVRLKTFDSH